MKALQNLFLLIAMVTGFMYLFLPGFLWLTDLIFRKPLSQRLFAVTWNKWGIAACLLGLGGYFWLRELMG